jgi:hypothetical protein
MSRYIARISLVATLLCALASCNQDRDCEKHAPAFGLWFSLSGIQASEIGKLVVEAQVGGLAPKTFTITTRLPEVFAGGGDQGQIKINLGADAKDAAFAKDEQLTVEIRAYEADGTLLGSSGKPSQPNISGLSLDACNFVDDLVVRRDGADAGTEGGGGDLGPPAEVWELQNKRANLEISGPGQGPPRASAVCNVVGDGKTGPTPANDIVVAFPLGKDSAGVEDVGRVYILPGPGYGDQGGGVIDVTKVANAVVLFGSAAGHRMGDQLLCDDIDGDGHDDLVIGAPGAAGGEGLVHVVFGAQTLPDVVADDLLTFFVPPSGGQPAQLGSALALIRGWSGDKLGVAMGAPSARDNLGAVYAALYSGSWSPGQQIDLQGISQTAMLEIATPLDLNDNFGEAITVSSDGQRLAVAVPAFAKGKGGVAVYKAGTGGWQLETSTLLQSSASSGSFGAALAFNDDGTVLFIGAPGESKIHVYVYENPKWNLHAGGPTLGTSQNKLALAAHGTFLVAGSAPDQSVTVFDATDWKALPMGFTTKTVPTPTTAVPQSSFGYSVAIHGSRIAVGAPDEGSNAGAIYTFTLIGQWTLEDRIGGTNAENFGRSVALGPELLAAGAPQAPVADAVRVYRRDNNAWKREPLAPVQAQAWALLGQSLALRDGWLIAGAPQSTVRGKAKAGAALVFQRVELGPQSGEWRWEQRAELTRIDAAVSDEMGTSVALAKQGAEVVSFTGAPLVSLWGTKQHDDAGAVFIFEPSPSKVVSWFGASSESRHGSALATGDLTGDSLDELVATAPGAVGSSATPDGVVSVLRGDNWAAKPIAARSIFGQDQQHGLDIWGLPNIGYGSSVAIAAFDGDSVADILIGVKRGDGDNGAVYLVSGADQLIAAPPALATVREIAKGHYKARYLGEATSDLFGDRLHTTADGDLLVAAPSWSSDRGSVYLIAPRTTGFAPQEAISSSTGRDVRLKVRGKSGAKLGLQMSSGAVDSNGGADLLLTDSVAETVHVIFR